MVTECLTCEKDLRDMGEGELVDLLEDDVVIHDLAEVRLAGSYSYHEHKVKGYSTYSLIASLFVSKVGPLVGLSFYGIKVGESLMEIIFTRPRSLSQSL